jgi:hypothetical protein
MPTTDTPELSRDKLAKMNTYCKYLLSKILE